MVRNKYESKDGYFYQKSNKHIVANFIISFIFLLGVTFSVGTCSNKVDSTRRQLDIVREQLDRETETNRQLRAELESAQSRLEQCQFIVNELGESTGRDITTVRDCIELIEEVRESIGAMEVALGMFDSDRYYDWLDNYIFGDEVINEGN